MSEDFDTIVVGSGIAGAMAAAARLEAGDRVLLVERGREVPRDGRNGSGLSHDLTPFFVKDPPIRVLAGGNAPEIGSTSCVGGASVFYGAVSLRYRERDFAPDPDVDPGGEAPWPFDYAALEPFYDEAERRLGVSGRAGEDPTEPRRSAPFPYLPPPLSPFSERIAAAAVGLGWKPFRLPLAINFHGAGSRPACVLQRNCDTYACSEGAKNDVASAVLPGLLAKGLVLRPATAALRLVEAGGRIRSVECADLERGERIRFAARRFVVAAGSLLTPHLLLVSALDRANPAGTSVGAWLTRHIAAIVYGIFPRRPDPGRTFHKQLGLHDFYFGDPAAREPRGKLGSIQQIHPPPPDLVRLQGPRLLRPLAPLTEHLAGLLVMAEDRPQPANRLTVDPARRDRWDRPLPVLEHRYAERDLRAVAALVRRAKQVLRAAGARAFYVHHIRTFSHALGTVRMGADARTSPLDPGGRFRGVENLWVCDGSALPRSAGVNPSLTIAANALRIARGMA